MNEHVCSNIGDTIRSLSASDPAVAFTLALASLESTQLCLDNAMFLYDESLKCNERISSILSQIRSLCERFSNENKTTVDVSIILHIIGDWGKE
jgi:hypothetical protein